MEAAGIRELKNSLSRYLKRVRAGAPIAVTEHGRVIATITPLNVPRETKWANALVASGRARWRGGKPAGSRHPVRLAGSPASRAVRDDRR